MASFTVISFLPLGQDVKENFPNEAQIKPPPGVLIIPYGIQNSSFRYTFGFLHFKCLPVPEGICIELVLSKAKSSHTNLFLILDGEGSKDPLSDFIAACVPIVKGL